MRPSFIPSCFATARAFCFADQSQSPGFSCHEILGEYLRYDRCRAMTTKNQTHLDIFHDFLWFPPGSWIYKVSKWACQHQLLWGIPRIVFYLHHLPAPNTWAWLRSLKFVVEFIVVHDGWFDKHNGVNQWGWAMFPTRQISPNSFDNRRAKPLMTSCLQLPSFWRSII